MTVWPHALILKPIVQWPGEETRTRKASQFSAGLSATLSTLTTELRHLGARDVIMQIAMRPEDFRIDGRPRANARPTHPGIILTMQSRHGALSYPCDTFNSWQDNLRAVALALEALRTVDRYGVTRRGEQYRGFAALEAPRAMPAAFRSEEDIVVFLASIGMQSADLATGVRAAKRRTHPDVGGDAATFDRVMQAEKFLRDTGAI